MNLPFRKIDLEYVGHMGRSRWRQGNSVGIVCDEPQGSDEALEKFKLKQ